MDTPKGSRNECKYDEEHGVFWLSRILPAGMQFPYDFGSIEKAVILGRRHYEEKPIAIENGFRKYCRAWQQERDMDYRAASKKPKNSDIKLSSSPCSLSR